MSELDTYLHGQTLHKLQLIESAQSETNDKLDTLTTKMDSALSWAQRLVLLGLSILGALGLNYSPDKLGEALAAALRALK